MELGINSFAQNYSNNAINNNCSTTANNAAVSFQGKNIKPKDAKKVAKAIQSYASAIISKPLKIVEKRVCNNGTVVKYLEDGSISIQGSNNVVKPLKSKITEDVTSTNAWKSLGKKTKDFEQASGHVSANQKASGVKKIDKNDDVGKKYIKRGYTHEVKVGDSDDRLFGKQLNDGSFEWSCLEHSKLHKKGKR